MAQDTPSCSLHMAGSIVGVGNKMTPKQYANSCICNAGLTWQEDNLRHWPRVSPASWKTKEAGQKL